MNRLQFFAQRSLYGFQLELTVFEGSPGDLQSVAKPLTMALHTGDRSAPPTMSLAMDSAQGLMDELWRSGLRPTEGSGSAGSLAATERHLEDMRCLVYKSKPKNI